MAHPSRKIIAVGIVCVALIGSVAYVKVSASDELSLPNAVLTTVELPELDVPIYATEDMTDTDGDNLKDWQEVIQGTDVNDADSDGDGTKDGDEIAAGRNPLVAGPNDKGTLITELKVGETEIYNAFVPHSITDNLSKNLFSAFAQARGQGEALDQATLEEIASSIAQDALAKNERVEKYVRSAIGTFPDSDVEAGEEFGERFSQIYIEMLETIEQSPNDLAIIAAEYQAFSKKLTALYVPVSLASTQAELGNSFYNIALMFSIINKYDQDPVRALVALKNLKELLAEQTQLFTAIGNYFRRNDIIFENQDTQRLWENI